MRCVYDKKYSLLFQPNTLVLRQFYRFACWELGISHVGHVSVAVFMTTARRDEKKSKDLVP
jgi:hypothetical protein